METQVALRPSPTAVDFNFDSTCSTPYLTAPSSPLRFPNFFFSAPTSPSRSGDPFYDGACASPSDTPQNRATQIGSDRDDDDDFAFDFSGKLRISVSAADELFHGGVIRPLKPPATGNESVSSVSPPRSSRSKKLNFPKSPRREESSGAGEIHRGSRSLSPIRLSEAIFHREDEEDISSNTLRADPKPRSSSTIASILSSISPAKTRRKWKLRDLLLFRSASEGRATGKEAVGKYAMLSSKKAAVEELRRRGTAVSAHEEHYTANRAAAEEMRRRTYLPYKQGLFGCLGLNPGVNEISRGIGSLTRG